MAVLARYDWVFALITIAFFFSAFGNGANDVANAYANSVAARTLTMLQVGFLSMITEFVGAVALGSRVTDTIKNKIIDLGHFNDDPSVLILAMACAEAANAIWLMVATRLGWPVSTTHTVVGSLVGVGIASKAAVAWSWKKGSVTQIVASWAIAPCIACAFGALLFGTLKFGILERRDPFKWAMRLIPFYLAFTGGVLALFIVVEAPTAASLEEFGAGKAVGIVLGVFFGVLLIAYVFFKPYFYRRLVKNDARVKWYHIPLGPLLWRDNPWIYFPANPEGDVVIDYYEAGLDYRSNSPPPSQEDNTKEISPDKPSTPEPSALENGPDRSRQQTRRPRITEGRERFLDPTKHLPLSNPRRLWSWAKYLFLQGITRDCVSYDLEHLKKTHELAIVYPNKVEHLWTYGQVTSAVLMSIAHGSNDVANAVGPWSAAYQTWQSGDVDTKSQTPVWMLAVAGILLGTGFWFFGFHITRALGNRITRLSPTRGYSAELGAAITVLLASRLALPVSTTQSLTGAVIGVALMNLNPRAVNWRQVLFIFSGWVLTLPVAGLIAGLLFAMAVNTPHFGLPA